jgi:hypothetical protein
MKSKIEQYKAELAELMETKNDPDTPKDIKDAIEPAIKKLNLLITGLGVKNLQSKVSKAPATSKKESKAPSTAKKSSDESLERCKEILAKYNDKKKTDAKRVEKRKKAGKPVELTPSETIKKAAKSVKTKVVEMDKGLKVSEEASIIRGILDSVVSAMSGIKDSHRKKMFIGKIIEGLRKLEKGVRMKTAEDGMYLHEINGDLEDDNAEMLRLNIVEIRHHADEIMQSLNGGSEVEAWVLSRSERAKTDMSDIAHYLDSSLKVDSMADGGIMAKGGLLKHGLRSGDVIYDGMLNTAFVYNRDRKLDYKVDLDKGERKELGELYHPPHFYEMADGGMMAKGGVSKDEKQYEASYKVQGIDSFMKFGAKSDREAIKLATTKLKRPNAELLNIYLVEGDKYTIIYGDSWESIRDTPKMAKGGQVHYDLFEAQDKIPKKVQDVLDDYVEYGEDITYEQLMSMQNDMERVGYTFDFGLDAIPYGLRPLGVDIDELQEYEENEYSDAGYYADGGMMAKGGGTKAGTVLKFDYNGMVFYDAKELFDVIDANVTTKKVVKFDAEVSVKQYATKYVGMTIDFTPDMSFNEFYNKLVRENSEYVWTSRIKKGGMMADGGMTAGRGRLLSALNRDRAYMSSQEWEKNYKRKGSPKKPKYNTSYAVGGQAKVKQYPDLSNTKPTVIN